MKGVLLGLDGFGMVPHLARLMDGMGFESVIALVNDPSLLRAEISGVPGFRFEPIDNPFEWEEVARSARRCGVGEADTIFLCVHDRLTFSYLKACDELGLSREAAFPRRRDAILRARLKPVARSRWKAAGVDPTRWTVLSVDEEASREWLCRGDLDMSEERDYVVKPVAGAGSEAVSLVKGWQACLKAAAGVRKHLQDSRDFKSSPVRRVVADGLSLDLFSDVLVEEAIVGAEFTVDGCVRGGRAEFVVQHKESRRTGSFFGDGLIVSPFDTGWDPRRSPKMGGYTASPVFHATVDDFRSLLERGLTAIDLDDWVFHCEVVEVGGQLRFIELNPRGAGGLLWKTAGCHLGIDPFEMTVRLAADFSFACHTRSGFVTGQFPIYAEREGRVRGLRGVAESRAVSGVVEVQDLTQYLTEAGLVIDDLNKENYLAFVHVEGPDHESVRAAERAVRRLIKPWYDGDPEESASG